MMITIYFRYAPEITLEKASFFKDEGINQNLTSRPERKLRCIAEPTRLSARACQRGLLS